MEVRAMAPVPEVLDARRCDELLSLIASVRDILDERVIRPVPPGWAAGRGWDRFLLGLTDDGLERCERLGLAGALPDLAGAPCDLADLAGRVAVATSLPRAATGAEVLDRARPLHVSPRKGAQIHLLLEVLGGLRGRVARVVDVGSGAGHLTRLASDAWSVPAHGLEREERLVDRARLLAEEGGATFERVDASAAPLDLRPSDLALGLHSCGVLADVLVGEAARARCAMALVACCHQKHPVPMRDPLSGIGRRLGLSFCVRVLGLANLHPRPAALGGRLADYLEERTARYALCLLLEGRGLRVDEDRTLKPPPGYRTYRGFPAMAEAECGRRGIGRPLPGELAECHDRARADLAVIRRLSLPRNLLGRLLEIGLAMDRAAFLLERGLSPRLGEAFPELASPRNLLLIAEP
jgi:hypothetical protein